MSSADPNGPGPERDDPAGADPRGHEGAPTPPLDAPVESAPADPALGSTPAAADRAPLPAAGAPAELTSDDDRPGQSPDGAAEVKKPRAPRDGLAPGEHEASITTTSSAAADDVPVVEEAVTPERTAPEGGDTRREGDEVPADTSDDTPDATAAGQAEPTDAPAPAEVADVRPTEATNADGSPVPADSSALAVTTTDVADEIAARGDVAAGPNEVTAAATAADDEASVDVHAEPSATDAPGDVAAPSGDAGATNPPVDAPTDLPATGAAATAETAEPEPVGTAAPAAGTEAVEPEAPVAEAPAAEVVEPEPEPAGPNEVVEPGTPVAEAPATEAEPAATEAEPAAPEADAATTDEPGSVSGEAATAAPEPEPEVVDEERQPLLDLLAERLGEGLVATHVVPGRDMTVRVTREAWVRAAEVCRDVLGMRYFGFLSAMDWMPSPYGRSEDGGLAGAGLDEAYVPPDPSAFEPGTTGGETRFQLLARLEVPAAPTIGITLKCDVPPDDLVMPTWTRVFPGADWHERECAEMFGIGFAGHPNLVKLYLPGAFEGFPLRKDFPLLARDVKPWPGLVDVEAMPGEEASTDDEGSVTAGAEEG